MPIDELLNKLVMINRRLDPLKSNNSFRTNAVTCTAATGSKIHFLAPELIEISLIKLFETIERIEDKFESLAVFWIGFIAIHPFNNANGRTAKEFLKIESLNLGLRINNLYQIDSILLTENTEDNKNKIINYLRDNSKIEDTK